MKCFIAVLLLLTTLCANAQRERFKTLSFVFTNHNSAKPFAKFSSLFHEALHPGFKVSYGFNWRTRPRHDWVQQFHAGYFFHRYVQHTLSLYTDVGYRYKFSKRFHTTIAIGGGYLHALPAVAVLEADENGTYRNAKGVGRAQVTGSLSLDARYLFKTSGTHSKAVFLMYQQQLQAPFIKSYVPLLPYNAVALGITIPLTRK